MTVGDDDPVVARHLTDFLADPPSMTFWDARGRQVDRAQFERALVAALYVWGNAFAQHTYCDDGSIDVRLVLPDRVTLRP